MVKVIWLDQAIEDFKAIQDYIRKNFGEYQLRNFTRHVFSFIKLLQAYPEIGPIQHKELQVRGFVISRLTTILYKVENNKLFIPSFIDNRSEHLFSEEIATYS